MNIDKTLAKKILEVESEFKELTIEDRKVFFNEVLGRYKNKSRLSFQIEVAASAMTKVSKGEFGFMIYLKLMLAYE